jgi:hypothetical protein
MYSKEDYIHDLYIKEHGSGVEQMEAEIRCNDYEHGRNPETAAARHRGQAQKMASHILDVDRDSPMVWLYRRQPNWTLFGRCFTISDFCGCFSGSHLLWNYGFWIRRIN